MFCSDCGQNLVKNQDCCKRFVYGIKRRFHTVDEDGTSQEKIVSRVVKKVDKESRLRKHTSDEEDLLSDSKWKLELAWLTKALEPALQLCRWALPTGLPIFFNSSIEMCSLSIHVCTVKSVTLYWFC